MKAKRATPLRELQSKRVVQEDTRLAHLFYEVRKLWLRAPAPSLALRQMDAVRNLLTKYARKGSSRT
jgi:hypothetical protein